MSKAIFKFNNRLLALLCSGCSQIIKVGKEFTTEEREACRGTIDIEPQYCKECQKKKNTQ